LAHVKGVTSAIQTQLNAKLDSSSYTAADVLSKLLTVDGAGSGLDADLLDGNSSAAFATAAQGTTADNALPKAGGTMTGDIQLGENTGIKTDASLSADGKYSAIWSEAGTLGETVAFGEPVYLKAADSQWYKTDASAVATAGVKVGICVDGGVDNDATTILFIGNIRADSLFPTFTIAGQVFLSETAGAMTQTAPTTTDSVTRTIGYANTADDMDVFISQDWVTHV
jgi:hypothetical protein